MKSLVLDAGPIISLAINNLLWILEPLHRHLGGQLYISKQVKKEIVDSPLLSRRYRLQALQVMQHISERTLEVAHNDQILQQAKRLQHLANTSFKAQGNWLSLLHFADAQSVSAALFLNANAVVIDERTTRLFVEQPSALKSYLEEKLHVPVHSYRKHLREFHQMTKGLTVLRSVELVTAAFELGLFDSMLKTLGEVNNPKRTLYESLLWSLKLSGCSISQEEIAEYTRLITSKKRLPIVGEIPQ